MRPSFKSVIIATCVIGLAIIVVGAERKFVHLGGSAQFSGTRVIDEIAPEQVEPGNTYLAAVASILDADHYDEHYWGYLLYPPHSASGLADEIRRHGYE